MLGQMKNSEKENILMNGFRFYNLEVFNWGTFDGKVYTINPNGRNSLLTGDIGSGKSTLVDAISTLIVPNNKIVYNKAAGAESKERNLYSYVRGEHKNTKDESGSSKPEYLRSDDRYTILLANFFNAGYNQEVCLAQVFYIKNNKVEKLFIVASVKMNIVENLSGFEDPIKLKKKLKQTPGIEVFDTFKEYSVRFCQLFGINQRDEALDLFNQTVSMKSVGNLTEFVRKQMLGKTDVKDSIVEVIRSFDDLTDSYNAVLKAKKQIDLLGPVVKEIDEYELLTERIVQQKTVLNDLQNWFSQKKIELLKHALLSSREDHSDQSNKIEQLRAEIKKQETSILEIDRDILSSDIGKQLESLTDQISDLDLQINKQRESYKEYSIIAEKLGLTKDVEEDSFLSNRKLIEEVEKKNNAESEILISERDKLKYEERTNLNAKKELEEDLEFLKNRNSQIDPRFLRMRNQIAEDLELDATDIPFVGELIQVRSDESDWQGAIERRLHDFGLSILVKDEDFTRIRDYVNDTDLKNKIVYLRTLPHKKTNNYEVKDNSLINKIEIKDDIDAHFFDWLETELRSRHNLVCCESMEEFNREEYAITKKGQIRSGRTRYEKDDRQRIDDKSKYILGWSNVEKIKALQKHIVVKELRQGEIEIELKRIKVKQDMVAEKTILLRDFDKYKDFNELDFKKSVINKSALEKTLKELKSSEKATQYNKLKALKDDKQDDLENNKETNNKWVKIINILEHRITEYSISLHKTLSALPDAQKLEIDELFDFKSNVDIFKNLNFHIEKWCKYHFDAVDIEEKNLTIIDEIADMQTLSLENIDEKLRVADKKLNADIGINERKNYTKENNINLGIQKFKSEFQSEAVDIDANIKFKNDVRVLYGKIVNDALPEHEETFKKRLREGTIKDLLIFSSKLSRDEKEIEKKISEINTHLEMIDYNPGTYIKIIENKITTKELSDFRTDLKNATQGVFGQTEAFSEEKFIEVKKLLDRFKSIADADKNWTNRVTDVTQWYTFGASERYREDHLEKEYFSDSSGKSGGQKEKLAYTILASAITYQFGLSRGEERTRSFRFVVIDEAFGKGSDESTRYGLRLFEELNLQLLIVTPLQKINIIEDYINTVHFVSNPAGSKSLVRNLTKLEYELEKNNYLEGVK
jgi:uncharacterized protein YPO0396